jgi:iron complex outermembrane recepter protein
MNFNLTSTYYLAYEQAYTPASRPVEAVSTAHNPIRFRFRGSFGWADNLRWITVATNYQGRYRDTDAVSQRPMNAWTTYDVAVGVSLGRDARASGPNTRLSLTASNVFNSYPPVLFGSSGLAYDADNSSLIGRKVGLTWQRRW